MLFYAPVYANAIIQAGGIPILIPLVPEEDIDELSIRLDGLFVTGGEDIDPGYYNEVPHVHLKQITTPIRRNGI